MLDWSENRNGNFVCKNDDSIKITVFSDRNDKWRGIMDNRITENGYATAEDAMKAIEAGEAAFVRFRPEPKTTDWAPAKKGGCYRYHLGQILTTKQAPNGQWFVTANGSLILDQWFPSFEATSRYADSLVC
jgi:hypothetical protein